MVLFAIRPSTRFVLSDGGWIILARPLSNLHGPDLLNKYFQIRTGMTRFKRSSKAKIFVLTAIGNMCDF